LSVFRIAALGKSARRENAAFAGHAGSSACRTSQDTAFEEGRPIP
jgi:hypothetical protein